ncbi:alkaline phosphatase D family protein [Haloarcula nitratireducens]|uniref:Alkaline phosphatase D family protein n=1 Tax=Haloarcula nitratireducens TaxID=2487749 RepID=A0AAW4P8H7_9EURY|nr:alkaline phosphatase D family protein [Halomicroarcula nitratireducens]MBX0294351.1 alkaline phosphatase D family protein [Halomicroarcula nitratireducens]
MSGEIGLDGRDEPSRTAEDHVELLSELDSHDLALAMDLVESGDADVFDIDGEGDPDAVFPQSVASGGPTPSGVILWTRVDPERFDAETPLGVQVATDETFGDVVYDGVVTDGERIAAHDYTVKVDVDGRLDPDTEYCYRFVYDGVASRTGRCQTLPRPEDSPDSLRIAVLACQNYLNGYFPALGHVAEEDVDFVVHLGDFIYESGDGHFKGLGSYEYEGRELSLPSGYDRVRNLDDYRYLHRTYRSDRFLQRALESHTLIAGWDDHEMVNDVYWDSRADAPAGDHPRGDDPEFMTELVADAMHAWWEYMPARVEYDPNGESLQERFVLWRSLEFGDLVSLSLTDERLFRDPPREAIPTPDNVGPHREPPGRTMLGEEQREWLVDTIADSEAKWTVWADEVLTIPFRLGSGPLSVYPVQGGWDGYTRERLQVVEAIAAADVENFVTLTGDMHCYVAGYQQTSYPGRVTGGEGVAQGERIGVEFMTPAVTSLNAAEALHLTRGLRGRLTEPLLSKLVAAMNPHIEFFDSHNWGYSVVEFTREDCTYVGYGVDKTVDSMDGDRSVVVAYRVPDGVVNLVDVTDEYRS